MQEGFSDRLLDWYDKNKRTLPWRDRQNPYYTWISEIMLQQTRVETVKPYFLRFISELPDVDHLAACPEEKLLKLWEGLGYYSRARNLKKAAVQMQERHGSAIPQEREELLKLSGIGEYTAGAILSIAFQKPVPAVDGNVLRVWARLTGYEDDITLPQAKTLAQKMAGEWISPSRPGDFNQALMELGALVCLPKDQVRCADCPVQKDCFAYLENRAASLPVRKTRKERKTEDRTVFVIRDGDFCAIRKRPGRGLLAGLYELPNEPGHYSPEEAREYVRRLQLEPLRITPLPEARHIFTHIEWRLRGYLVRVAARENAKQEGLIFVNGVSEEDTFAIPSAFSAFAGYMKEEIR